MLGYWILATLWLLFSYFSLEKIWYSDTGCLFETQTNLPIPQLVVLSCLPLLTQTLIIQILKLLSSSTSQSFPILNILTKTSHQSFQLTLIFFCSLSTANELKILSIPQLSSSTLSFLLTISLYTLGSLIDFYTKSTHFSFPGKSSNILNTSLILSLLFRDFYYNFKQSTL